VPITSLTLAVVGADFPNRRGPTRRFAIGLCRPGDRVFLLAEPKNPADPRAVMVLNSESMMMGYITAERCGWIGAMIAEGRELKAIFQEPTLYGALIRVSLDANEPDLPPERVVSRQIDWWPDDAPPDD
jgi:hypothetical protein